MVSVYSEGSGSALLVYWAGYLLNLVAKLPCAALLRLAWFGLGPVWFGISTAPRPELPDSSIRVKGSRLPSIRPLTPKSLSKNPNSLKCILVLLSLMVLTTLGTLYSAREELGKGNGNLHMFSFSAIAMHNSMHNSTLHNSAINTSNSFAVLSSTTHGTCTLKTQKSNHNVDSNKISKTQKSNHFDSVKSSKTQKSNPIHDDFCHDADSNISKTQKMIYAFRLIPHAVLPTPLQTSFLENLIPAVRDVFSSPGIKAFGCISAVSNSMPLIGNYVSCIRFTALPSLFSKLPLFFKLALSYAFVQLIVSTVFFMFFRQQRQHCFMQAANQAGINDWNLQQATGRIPPGWNPERDRQYSFRNWLVDLRLWQVGTDIVEARQGPLVAMRLLGAAKDMIRELDPQILANGRAVVDQFGNNLQQTGFDYLIELLTARFAPLEQEVQLSAIHDLFMFKRQAGDATDSVITRFEIMIHRTNALGNIQLQPMVKAYMLLQALGIHRERWTILLAPTLGMLPGDMQEYQAFLGYLRRQGHLHEGTTHANVRANTQHYWMTDEASTAVTAPAYWTGEATWTANEHTHDAAWTSDGTGYAATQTYYDNDDTWYEADDESSGHSHASEPIDLSDVAHLPDNIAGETLYLGYRFHKRKFRHFTRSGPRKGKGKGRFRKGKGKGHHHKGKSGKPLFYADGTQYEDEEDSVFEVYYGSGKGKSGKAGKGRRKNPIGKDGKVMLCSGCDSDEHFIRNCPKGKGKGGKGKSASKAPTSSGFYEHPSSAASSYSYDTPTSTYLASSLSPATTIRPASRIIYYDGTSEVVEHTLQEEPSPATIDSSPYMSFFWLCTTLFLFPWWSCDYAFHALVRLKGKDREGLLVDCGAVSNLAGDKWVERTSKLAALHGQGTTMESRKAQTVEGVGSGSSTITQQAKVPVCIASGDIGSFDTAVVSNSELPALMGLESLERNRALIDVIGKKLIYIGQGGYELKLSPGSLVMQLEKVPSGHLLLPSSEWDKKKGKLGPVLAHLVQH